MKVSIPAFFTSLFFGLMLWLSGLLIYSTGSKFLDESTFTPELIGVGLIYLIFPATLTFIVIKWKLVFIDNKQVRVLYPLRLKSRTFNLNDISSAKWKLWGTYRTGDYQVMELRTKNGMKVSISDLEFQNYLTLETAILNSLTFKANLKTRNENRYEQAKSNMMFSIIMVVFSVVIGLTSYTKMNETNFEVFPPILIFTLCCLILLRLIFQITDYTKRIRNKA